MSNTYFESFPCKTLAYNANPDDTKSFSRPSLTNAIYIWQCRGNKVIFFVVMYCVKWVVAGAQNNSDLCHLSVKSFTVKAAIAQLRPRFQRHRKWQTLRIVFDHFRLQIGLPIKAKHSDSTSYDSGNPSLRLCIQMKALLPDTYAPKSNETILKFQQSTWVSFCRFMATYFSRKSNDRRLS